MKVTARRTYWCTCGKARHPHAVDPQEQEKHTRGNLRDIRVDSIEFCCMKMEEALEECFVVFGECDIDTVLNKDASVNIVRTHCYPEGAVSYGMPIKRCPFCGFDIEVTIVDDEMSR